jgi:hypothetical protein
MSRPTESVACAALGRGGEKIEGAMLLLDRASESRVVAAITRLLIATYLRHLARALRRVKRRELAVLDAETRREIGLRRRGIEAVLRDSEWQRLCGGRKKPGIANFNRRP